jgi:hypothetical protein
MPVQPTQMVRVKPLSHSRCGVIPPVPLRHHNPATNNTAKPPMKVRRTEGACRLRQDFATRINTRACADAARGVPTRPSVAIGTGTISMAALEVQRPKGSPWPATCVAANAHALVLTSLSVSYTAASAQETTYRPMYCRLRGGQMRVTVRARRHNQRDPVAALQR